MWVDRIINTALVAAIIFLLASLSWATSTPPVVTIISPTDGQVVAPGKFFVQVRALDDTQVVAVSTVLNNLMAVSCSPPVGGCENTWVCLQDKSPAPGPQVLVAYATDDTGQQSQTSITLN